MLQISCYNPVYFNSLRTVQSIVGPMLKIHPGWYSAPDHVVGVRRSSTDFLCLDRDALILRKGRLRVNRHKWKLKKGNKLDEENGCVQNVYVIVNLQL